MQQKRIKDTVLLGNTIFWVPWSTIEFKFFLFFFKYFPFLRLKPRFRRVKPFPFFQGSYYWQEPWYSGVLPKGLQTWPPFGLVTDCATKFHNQKTSLLHDTFLQHCWGSQLRKKMCVEKFMEHAAPCRGAALLQGHVTFPSTQRWKSVLNSKCSISALSPHEL